MKSIIVIVVVFLFSFYACNRDSITKDIRNEDYPVWIAMMEQPGVEIEKAREAFDGYWENHEHFKGDRSKQFERWYAINSNRLDQYGKVIPATVVSSEYQKLKKQSNAETQGQWFNYGPISVGPRNGTKRDGGRVKDIEFHPSESSTFYVSTFKGGLFKTTDYGVNWEALTDALTEQVFVCEVSTADPSIIYIGTDLGVYKSSNGGATWSSTSITNETKGLLLKDNNQDVLIAGSANGIHRSTDGGSSWVTVKSANKVENIVSHPTNPEIIYATTNGNPSEFFRSDDGGLSWTKNDTFGQGCFMGVAVTPAQSNYVYVINLRDHLGDDSFEGFYFSDDSGVNFTKQSGVTPCISGYKADGSVSRGQPNYNMFVCADPVNADIVYAGGVKSWKSEDKGKTWTHFYEDITTDGDNLHLDQLNWAYSPHDNRIFSVNDGGVYYLNEENKFQMITDGLPIAEIYECTQSQTVKTNVAGGTMHCGIKLNNGGVWYTPWGGDEATCIIDPTDEKYIYHLKYEKISRSSDGGFTYKRINSTDADRGYYTGTGALHKGDPNTLFVGLLEVERTNAARAASVNWEKISSFGGSTKIQKVEQCTASHDILYVARGSSFYRTDNANAASPSFTNLTSNLPASGSVNDIATHPTNSNIVFILLGSQIYKSSDKGNSWINISANLPSVALLEMVYDNTADEGIYVGTDIGVFYKDASMTDWIDYSKDLAAIRVSGMDIYYGDNRDDSFITVSTDGRGFWRSLLYGATEQLPTADFTADKTTISVTETVNFTNTSDENPVGSFIWNIEGADTSVNHELNPSITFNDAGTYTVSLEVTNSAGVATKSMEIVVNPLSAPVAVMSANITTVTVNNLVEFTDESENLPTSWEWTFEGGTPSSSTEQHPVVSYNTVGVFDVTLKVTNSEGEDTQINEDYITVIENTGTGTLQGHYEFSGNLIDSSSYQRDLAVIGDFDPVFTNDKNGHANMAYEAPGSNDNYLTCSYMGVSGNGERTIIAWFKTNTSSPSRKTIVAWGKNSQGQMFNLMVQDDGTIRVEGGSCSLRSTTAGLNDDTWHHVAVTFDPADGDKLKDVKIYIDGVLDVNQTDAGSSYRSEQVVINTDNTTNAVRIGSVEYSNYYWTGCLDDVRIYDESLSASEISEIYGIKTAIGDLPQGRGVNFYSGHSKIRLELNTGYEAQAYIYTTKGALVCIKQIYRGMNNIALKQGLYIVKVKVLGGVETEKVICY